MAGSRLAGAYRGLALLAWNSLLVLVALNLLALLASALGLFAPPPTGPLRYGMERLSVVYPGLEERQIVDLLEETWSREYIYEPLVQHREAARRGDWVNVDEAGFRHSAEQGPWPPPAAAAAVFFYGGSTAFGYGVGDRQTVPSRLQEALNERGCDRPVRVYNFGRGNYYGEQERVLFGLHLTAGQVPAVAVFLDGLNEWKDDPKFTGRLEYLMSERPAGAWRRALKTLPLIDLLRQLRRQAAGADVVELRADAASYGEIVVERWLAGRRSAAAIAEAFGVRTLFVWQPVPTYQYGLEHHLFAEESAAAFARHGPLQHGYARLDSLRRELPELEPATGFLWLADLQLGRPEPLYVDAAHYTAAFSRDLAERIAAELAPAVGCGTAGAAAQAE